MNRLSFFSGLILLLFIGSAATAQILNQKKLLLTEQARNRLLIVDVQSKNILWEWMPQQSNVAAEHIVWFNAISDAKPVFNGRYVLLTASGGAVALVRLLDKKTLFYANAGKNPHSVEMLPDGNIVTAASTGNVLTLFKVDTLQAVHTGYKKTYFIRDGHNVVWDKKRQQLWATSGDTLKAFTYNNNCNRPELIESEKVMLPNPGAHDLFPVFGEDALWFTNVSNIYKFDLRTKTFKPFPTIHEKDIKSVSSGPRGYPIIMMRPKEQWWSDEVFDNQGNSIFRLDGLKIYKARWFVDNQFSYPEKHLFNLCK